MKIPKLLDKTYDVLVIIARYILPGVSAVCGVLGTITHGYNWFNVELVKDVFLDLAGLSATISVALNTGLYKIKEEWRKDHE